MICVLTEFTTKEVFVFGLITRNSLNNLLEQQEQRFQSRLREYELKLEDRLDDIKTPAEPAALAEEALRQILARVNPAEFLNNLLAARGITIDGIVKIVVAEKLKELGLDSSLLSN